MAPVEGDNIPNDKITLARWREALKIRRIASSFSKWLCKRFGHKEVWRGSFFETGNGELTCYCKRCGEDILSGIATRLQ